MKNKYFLVANLAKTAFQLAFLFCVHFTFGQEWTAYTTEDGLASNWVTSITTDKEKNIWFATSKGVSKFDGTKFTNYTSTDGLASDWVTCITTDKEGNLWFGTQDGVSKFDGEHWKSYTTADGLASNSITCITKDKAGNIWFGTDRGGVSKFDGVNWKSYTTTDGLVNNYVTCITIDLEGNFWFGTTDGVSKFDGTTWKTYDYTNGIEYNGHIKDIKVDQAGNIWLVTTIFDLGQYYGRVLKFDGSNWINYTFGPASSGGLCLTPDKSGNVWCGTPSNGISIFDGTNWTSYTIVDGLIDNYVISIAIDQQGNKWFGTLNGVSKFSDGGTGPFDIFETKIIDTLTATLIFNDENENGIKDSIEKGISGLMIQVDSTFSFSKDNGFIYSELKDGSHTISFKTPENWKFTTDSAFTINVPNNGDTLYFGIKAIENRPDLKVNVTSGPTRSNFSANYWVNYKNVGSVTESGTVEVVLDSTVAFESSIPATSSIDGQKLRFDFTDLGFNEKKQIRITTKMPNVEFLGDTLTTVASIHSNFTDVDSSNNSDTLSSVLTGSYDPNDKTVHQGVLDSNYVLFGKTLDYTIRFQNTGNDTAFNVNITDTISSNMDLSSFELIGSSHPCQLEVKGTNTMIFHFYDILLPDSTTNELGSHGYVQYRIQPKKGLAENTKVKNTGYIYFDYNPAIVTNTTLNTYVSKIPKTGTNGISFIPANQKVSVYPNPTEGMFTINLGSVHEKTLVQLTDLQGREIKSIESVSSQFIPFTINEKPGIYLIQVRSEKGSEVVKVMVK